MSLASFTLVEKNGPFDRKVIFVNPSAISMVTPAQEISGIDGKTPVPTDYALLHFLSGAKLTVYENPIIAAERLDIASSGRLPAYK